MTTGRNYHFDTFRINLHFQPLLRSITVMWREKWKKEKKISFWTFNTTTENDAKWKVITADILMKKWQFCQFSQIELYND